MSAYSIQNTLCLFTCMHLVTVASLFLHFFICAVAEGTQFHAIISGLRILQWTAVE